MTNNSSTGGQKEGQEMTFTDIKFAVGNIFWHNIQMNGARTAIEGNPAIHRIAEWVYSKLSKKIAERWVKCMDRMPVLPSPLPMDTPEERGVLFVNRKHSAAQFWYPSYGYAAEVQFPLEADVDRKLYDIGWGREEWEWLDESPSLSPEVRKYSREDMQKSFFEGMTWACDPDNKQDDFEAFDEWLSKNYPPSTPSLKNNEEQ